MALKLIEPLCQGEDILSSAVFKNYPSLKVLLKDFDDWKGSPKEETYWEGVLLKEKERKARLHLQSDGIDTAVHFAARASSNLRRSPSFELTKKPNKHVKLSHEEKEDNWEIWEEEDPVSDITVDHHPSRKGDYYVYADSEEPVYDEDTHSDVASTWMVGEVNLSEECDKYRESCLTKSNPKELNDVGVLAINCVYVFMESLSHSITRHFNCAESHHLIFKSLGVLDGIHRASPQTFDWCTQCASCTCTDWRDLQRITVKFLNEALESKSDLDLIVANVLHRMLPLLKIVGNDSQRGEDSFVHDTLGPLLDVVFSFDVSLNHFWANKKLNDYYKPDYGVYCNGLSKRYVVLIAEFKPNESRENLESDFVKIGKSMKFMLNEILEIGVQGPVVCGIHVNNNKIKMYKMELKSEKIYVMTQLCSISVVTTSDDLTSIPGIISGLEQVKSISKETCKKVHAQVKRVKNGDSILGTSVPPSWISKSFFSLARKNSK